MPQTASAQTPEDSAPLLTASAADMDDLGAPGSKEQASRTQSFASTTVGSPLSVTTDVDGTPLTLRSLEEVFNPGFCLTGAAPGVGADDLRFRTPTASPSDVGLETPRLRTTSDATPLRFRTPVASASDLRATTSGSFDVTPSPSLPVRTTSVLSTDSLYTSLPSWSRSTSQPWPRLRFASYSEDLKERRPFSTADVISKYESSQSATYKEYRKWKESKWGEDALDEVEFEDDDVNLELSIPAVFSSPLIQLPSMGDALHNVYERVFGYTITVSDLLINADYYLKYPKDLWQNALSAFWMLLPTPPKHIVDSFISVVCESSNAITEESTIEMTTQQFIEESGMAEDPLMAEDLCSPDASGVEQASSVLQTRVPEEDTSEEQRNRLRYWVLQQLKWSLRVLVFIVSICLALAVILAARLYDVGAAGARLFALFDSGDFSSWQYIPWTSFRKEEDNHDESAPPVSGTDGR
eukprot:Gregarina_sp_Pseudo_9__3138@NODE_332_length_3137_cov_74_877986_g312_i0_p1_GENE_NODE_332_length_3137_cov_74_877986_g312_i0NODE_332_length_3137_cov_74_877986_g312_i0_p1_ORF_typecomplete_len468_score88_94Foamy_virus_ENV/PF03408_14/0_039_NODE_332_length_3137_cov_74_877986_g312_i014612864